MSFLTALLLPKLEQALLEMEPKVAELVVSQLAALGGELVKWLASAGAAAAAKPITKTGE